MSLFAIPDEKFEPELGPLVKSWGPIPGKDVEGGVQLGCFFTLLTMATLPAGFLLAGTIAVLCNFDHSWRIQATLFLAVALIGLIFFGVNKLGHMWFQAGRLAVHEQGIRYRKSVALFEGIESIAFGLDSTFAEKHLPTLEKFQEIRGQRYDYKERKEVMKRCSVGIQKRNGPRIDWKWVLNYFTAEDLRDFAQLVEKQAPGLFSESRDSTR